MGVVVQIRLFTLDSRTLLQSSKLMSEELVKNKNVSNIQRGSRKRMKTRSPDRMDEDGERRTEETGAWREVQECFTCLSSP